MIPKFYRMGFAITSAYEVNRSAEYHLGSRLLVQLILNFSLSKCAMSLFSFSVIRISFKVHRWRYDNLFDRVLLVFSTSNVVLITLLE